MSDSSKNKIDISASGTVSVKEREAVQLWEKALKPLLLLCNDQSCTGVKKKLLKKLLEQTKGTRESYKEDFDETVDGVSQTIEKKLDDVQNILRFRWVMHKVRARLQGHYLGGNQSGGVATEEYRQAAKKLSGGSSGIPVLTHFFSDGSAEAQRYADNFAPGCLNLNEDMLKSIGILLPPSSPSSATTNTSLNNRILSDYGIYKLMKEMSLLGGSTGASSAANWVKLYRQWSTEKPYHKGFSDDPQKNVLAAIMTEYSYLMCASFQQIVFWKLCCSVPHPNAPGVATGDGTGPAGVGLGLVEPHRFKKAPVKQVGRIAAKAREYAEEYAKKIKQEEDTLREDTLSDKEDALREKELQSLKAELTAPGRVLDTFRCSLTIEDPLQMLNVVEAFKACTLDNDGMVCYRMKNLHHQNATVHGGYRDIKCNMLFRTKVRVGVGMVSSSMVVSPTGGDSHTQGHHQDTQVLDSQGELREVTMIGEVILIFKKILDLKKHMHLVYAIKRGDY